MATPPPHSLEDAQPVEVDHKAGHRTDVRRDTEEHGESLPVLDGETRGQESKDLSSTSGDRNRNRNRRNRSPSDSRAQRHYNDSRDRSPSPSRRSRHRRRRRNHSRSRSRSREDRFKSRRRRGNSRDRSWDRHRERRRDPSRDRSRERSRRARISRSPPRRSEAKRETYEPHDRQTLPHVPTHEMLNVAATAAAASAWSHKLDPTTALNQFLVPASFQVNPFAPTNTVLLATQQLAKKNRRLYVGNLPFHVGITEPALTEFFNALYLASFQNKADEFGSVHPVLSVWLHSDGKFGFMELRSDRDAVNTLQLNGVYLHGRALKIGRPSDYQPVPFLPKPDPVNIDGLAKLCEQLGGVAAPPATLTPPLHQTPSALTALLGGNTRNLSDFANRERAISEDKSRVLCLSNLITEKDLEEYDDLLDEIQEECDKYGPVEDLVIPRDGPGFGKVFVSYGNVESAKKAYAALRGRAFDGRSVEATFSTKHSAQEAAISDE